MNSFIYENKTKVYFGCGCVDEHFADAIKKYGDTVMIAYGGGSVIKTGIYGKLRETIEGQGKRVVDFPGIMSNPTYRKVQQGAALAREQGVSLILAVGGGSVIDCCKIISAQAKMEEDIWTMKFEKNILPTEFVPMGVVVTASGTGAEMNGGAIITNEEKKIKASVTGARAEFAFLDPLYTLTVPRQQVISGAFDTLSHAMESYFGKPEENCMSDDLGEAVMRSVIRNMRVLINDINNVNARSELMWASSICESGLLKIGKTTDFQVHHLEHQLGAYTDCNHGQALAVIHPVLYRHIYEYGLERFSRFAENVWGILPEGKTKKELAEAGIEALAAFIKECSLPWSLREMGVTDNSCFRAVAESCNIMEGCCKRMSADELFDILNECF